MKLIDIKNLKFEYFRRDDEGNVDEMIEALKGVSLDVEPGQFVAIVGANGSGKSTLAKHINALLLPSEGAVVVDGMDIEDEELRLQIKKTAGMVFQNPDNQIVANLVEEDIAFGPENLGVLPGDIWNRVDKSLELTNMQVYRRKSPNQLSGGQKQRVAIAGVLAMEPKCIIFDEATAMLDPAGRKKILAVAKRLQQENGITIIWITHYMDEVLSADHIFVMKAGMIEMQGKPADLFASPECLEECGLALPPFHFFLQFLKEQDIITEEEKNRIYTVKQLVQLLARRYGEREDEDFVKMSVRQGIDEALDFSGTVESVSQPSQGNGKKLSKEGLILDRVTYIYNKGYANETVALKDISLVIGKGEFVAVVGPTGSGKSTLMQHLNGLYLPMEGAVYYDGQDIADRDYNLKQLRQKVGLLFQYPEYQLFAETVEQDVAFGPRNMNITKLEAQKRAYEAIAAVGLPDTIYDVSPVQLSGGQKRRVALAGVLAMHPEFLVLDEPTAGLDPVSAKNLLDLLKRLQEDKGITVLLVSHNMEEVAEYADRVIVLNQGKICMDAAAWEIFSKEEALRQFGLDVPIGIQILNGLKNVTGKINRRISRRETICDELLKLKHWKD